MVTTLVNVVVELIVLVVVTVVVDVAVTETVFGVSIQEHAVDAVDLIDAPWCVTHQAIVHLLLERWTAAVNLLSF